MRHADGAKFNVWGDVVMRRSCAGSVGAEGRELVCSFET